MPLLFIGSIDGCSAAIWVLLLNDVFRTRETTEQQQIAAGLLQFQSHSADYYAAREAELGACHVTRTSRITPKMIGSRGAGVLKLKAG